MMRNKALGIYIHIPFCVKKCDYCDFLSAPTDTDTMRAYVEALKREIMLCKNEMTGYCVDTVFIGGGTPSILEEDLIRELLIVLQNHCHFTNNPEITMECNPGTLTEEKLKSYAQSGIHRLSMGLQSANDKELGTIGRIHTYGEFLESYHLARECGFSNINIDLISALPGQTLDTFKETLEKVIALQPEHMSVYSLIVEEHTKLKKRIEDALLVGKNILPDEDDERKMYHLSGQLLKNAGYARYEISNYAKPGFMCRHNIGYWKRKECLGFGIGAASLYQNIRYQNTQDLKQYLEIMSEVQTEKQGINSQVLKKIRRNREVLSKKEQMAETMILGLRMDRGVSIAEFEETYHKSITKIYGTVIQKYCKLGLLEIKDHHIGLTPRGIDVSNTVMADFL